VLQAFKIWHENIKAQCLRYWRAREVVKVLKITHAQELADTPVNMWVQKKAAHAQEIAAVRNGQFSIVDRRSWAYPYIPEALHRLNQPILKNTPYNLRRFAETPVPRRALNIIKNAIIGLKWRITIDDNFDQDDPDLIKNSEIAEYCLQHPNLVDSYRTLMEAVVEDFLLGGYGTMEPQITPDYRRPLKLWAVDGSTIRIYADWSEGTPDRPHYAQLTGLKGERGIISFLDDELVYIRDNVRSSTPFGLGRMEVCFLTINAFLGIQDMGARAGADQIHKTWLWWPTNVPPGQMETVRRHIQNDAEGQAKVSLMGGLPKPEVVEVQPVTPDDLLLDWQNLLIRIIAAGFELSPMALGLERDVNRNTATVMAEQDFNSAVVPVARKFEEAITRLLLHRTLGWRELKFEFVGLEDPDEMVQTMLCTKLYQANCMTPDEIRDRMQIGGEMEGGWGKLTFAQMALITAAAVGKAGGAPGAQGTGLGGNGSGGAAGQGGAGSSGGFGGGGGMGMGSLGMTMGADRTQIHGSVPSLWASPFNAQDISQMDPDTVELYRQAGLIPTNGLASDMESQQPGILQTLSEELLEYFEWLEQEAANAETDPAPVTTADQKKQAKKYKDHQHQLTSEEKKARGRDYRTNLYETQNYQGPVPGGKGKTYGGKTASGKKQRVFGPKKPKGQNYTGRSR
jgi:uncharacterized membrane protein YgcG